MLLDLQPDSVQQGELDLDVNQVPKRGMLMQVLDGLNDRYGEVRCKWQMANGKWQVRAELKTGGYGP